MLSTLTPPVQTDLSDSELNAIGKLLLNSWSAEYALRLTPLTANNWEAAEGALHWTFPQAYYAAFFSARAVLATDRILVANHEGVNTLMNGRAGAGFYGPSLTTENNPFSALMVYQIKSAKPAAQVVEDDPIGLNRRLINSVHAIALIHETYVLGRIGQLAYDNIILSLPSYLRDGFVGTRAIFLSSND